MAWTALWLPPVAAVDQIALDIGSLFAEGWHLEGLKASLEGIDAQAPRLTLHIDAIALPEPLGDLRLVKVTCGTMRLTDTSLVCRQGRGELHTSWLDQPHFQLEFALTEGKAELTLAGLRLAGGRVALKAIREVGAWRIHGVVEGVRAESFKALLAPYAIDPLQGRLDGVVEMRGGDSEVESADVKLSLKDLSAQTEDGLYAGEGLVMDAKIALKRTSPVVIAGEAKLHLLAGAVYADPIFLDAGADGISMSFVGAWNRKTGLLNLEHAEYSHPSHGQLRARGVVDLAQSPRWRHLLLELESSRLASFYGTYAAPFLVATDLEGLAPDGELSARVVLHDDGVARVDGRFTDVSIDDSHGRLQLGGGTGEVRWSKQDDYGRGRMAWDNARLYAIPIGGSEVSLETGKGLTRLREGVRLPVLGGELAVTAVAIEPPADGEPDIRFDGRVDNVSLEQLSAALGWLPLAGTISGKIPGVSFQAGSLKLDGQLRIQVFDGEVVIDALAVADLFGELPSLSTDVRIHGLELSALTDRFEFGSIEGRLDGWVRGLVLEAWRPVAFDAWFGTPKGDDSRRRISQKAVETLTDIGGGGAANVLSQGFMRLFDSFRYRSFGIGCRLQGRVCELSGVEPAGEGYYIVKGGGVPRINVIGYNRRIDWNVLLGRLQRVTSADTAVVD